MGGFSYRLSRDGWRFFRPNGHVKNGQLAEWPNAPVLKTVRSGEPRHERSNRSLSSTFFVSQ